MNLTKLSSIFQRVRKNVSASPYLHLAATATIAFSLLVIGVFAMLYVNISALIHSWQQDVRVVAYLKNELSEEWVESLRQSFAKLNGVEEVTYVSKDEAMARLRRQMKHRLSLLEGLRENPLPASFELRLVHGAQTPENLDLLASQLRGFPEVADLGYGETWFNRFSGFIGFFRLASLIIGGLVIAITVFVCANTIRLTLYAKREEIEIMRLVGATDAFIKIPFYVQNLIEGLLGGLVALVLLFGSFRFLFARIQTPDALLSSCDIRFISFTWCAALLAAGMFVGWFGSFLSLKSFLRS